MIIWINGAFGAGKTQTACELQRRLPGSYIYDPENAGFFIRSNLPASIGVEDFQDYSIWRAFNLKMLDYICERYDGHIIVPMTITNRIYYEELVGALSQKYDVKHVILYATKQTLLKRLASRFEGGNSWAAQQIDRCIQAFNEDIVEHRVHTDELNIEQVVERIAQIAGIALSPDRRSSLRKRLDRVVTQCKHIR